MTTDDRAGMSRLRESLGETVNSEIECCLRGDFESWGESDAERMIEAYKKQNESAKKLLNLLEFLPGRLPADLTKGSLNRGRIQGHNALLVKIDELLK